MHGLIELIGEGHCGEIGELIEERCFLKGIAANDAAQILIEPDVRAVEDVGLLPTVLMGKDVDQFRNVGVILIRFQDEPNLGKLNGCHAKLNIRHG